MKVDEFLQVVTVQTITFFGLCVTRGREEREQKWRAHTKTCCHAWSRAAWAGSTRWAAGRDRGSPWLTPGTCSNMVWKSWTPLLLLALCKSGADGPSFLSLPPSLESHTHTLKGNECLFLFFFLDSGTNRSLSPVFVMSPNTGTFYRSLSLSKMAISDKTGKPETGCNSSVLIGTVGSAVCWINHKTTPFDNLYRGM